MPALEPVSAYLTLHLPAGPPQLSTVVLRLAGLGWRGHGRVEQWSAVTLEGGGTRAEGSWLRWGVRGPCPVNSLVCLSALCLTPFLRSHLGRRARPGSAGGSQLLCGRTPGVRRRGKQL